MINKTEGLGNGADSYSLLPDMLFSRVAQVLGPSAVRELIGLGGEAISRGRAGVTMTDEHRELTVTTNKDGVSFEYWGWGPYKVETDRALDIIGALETETKA